MGLPVGSAEPIDLRLLTPESPMAVIPKKQKTVALSSCEAEIVAASEAAKEAVHLSRLATELKLHDGSPIDLHMDNKSAIDVAYNPEHHGRMKHVHRRHFFVRELVEDHLIRVPFVSTVNNWADFFTKPLPTKSFESLRDRIMNAGVVATGGRCEESDGVSSLGSGHVAMYGSASA
jgi:hypothetical protein